MIIKTPERHKIKPIILKKLIILSIPITKIASAIDHIKQASIELIKKTIGVIDEMPAMKGIKGLIAGISLPIRIPTQPYFLKKSSPLIKTVCLFCKNFSLFNLGPKNNPE